MSVLPLVIAPDDFLKQKSIAVENASDGIADDIKLLIKNMYDTMYASRGIGLSAVQVGVLLRIIIVDVEHKIDKNGNITKQKQFTMINPIITSHSNEIDSYEEGCLSFPEQCVVVKRPKIINVDYIDENGKDQQITADGLFGICIQHEIDHLNGITIINYASRLKEELIMKRLKKIKDKQK